MIRTQGHKIHGPLCCSVALALLAGYSDLARGSLVFDTLRYDGHVSVGGTQGVEGHFGDFAPDLEPPAGVDDLPADNSMLPGSLDDGNDLRATLTEAADSFMGMAVRHSILTISAPSSSRIFNNDLDNTLAFPPVQLDALVYSNSLDPPNPSYGGEKVFVKAVLGENEGSPFFSAATESITAAGPNLSASLGSPDNKIRIQLGLSEDQVDDFRYGFLKVHIYYMEVNVVPPALPGLAASEFALNDESGPDGGFWRGSVAIDVDPVSPGPPYFIDDEVEATAEWAAFAPGQFQRYLDLNHPGAIAPSTAQHEVTYAYQITNVTKAVPGVTRLSVGHDIGDAARFGNVMPSWVSNTGNAAPLFGAAEATQAVWAFDGIDPGDTSNILVYSSIFSPEPDSLHIGARLASGVGVAASMSDRTFHGEPGDPPQVAIGSFGDLSEVHSFKLPGGARRAEQGLTWADGFWVTSQGSVYSGLSIADRILSRFSSNWKQLLSDRDYTIPAGMEAVHHIGDVAYAANLIYAPIQVVNVEHQLDIEERIAAFDSETLDRVAEWRVPGNVRLAGLEFFDGLLYGVEHVEDGAAAVVVYDVDDASEELYRIMVNVPLANGISIHDGRVYITSGKIDVGELILLRFNTKDEIHVFDLGDFTSSLAPDTVLDAWDGYGIYTYRVPGLLHAEGLAFRDDELWVALGDYVAQLDLSSVITARATCSEVVGLWNPATLGINPTLDTSLSIAESTISIEGAAETGHLHVTRSSLIEVLAGGSLVAGGALAVRDGEIVVQGGSVTTGNLVIGGADGAIGRFTIADGTSEIVVSRRLVLDEGGAFSAVQGAVIHLTGSDVENRSTSPDAYQDMVNLTLVFEGGPNVVDLLEVAGKELEISDGSGSANFVLGSLQLGSDAGVGKVMLVDIFDNQLGWEGAEILQVNQLMVNPGSILYLNGVRLYVQGTEVRAGEGRRFGGGLILTAIPEPNGFLMVATCMVILIGTRRVVSNGRT